MEGKGIEQLRLQSDTEAIVHDRKAQKRYSKNRRKQEKRELIKAPRLQPFKELAKKNRNIYERAGSIVELAEQTEVKGRDMSPVVVLGKPKEILGVWVVGIVQRKSVDQDVQAHFAESIYVHQFRVYTQRDIGVESLRRYTRSEARKSRWPDQEPVIPEVIETTYGVAEYGKPESDEINFAGRQKTSGRSFSPIAGLQRASLQKDVSHQVSLLEETVELFENSIRDETLNPQLAVIFNHPEQDA